MFGFLNSELSQDDGKVFSCMLANQSAYIRGITLYIFRYTGQADGLIIVLFYIFQYQFNNCIAIRLILGIDQPAHGCNNWEKRIDRIAFPDCSF